MFRLESVPIDGRRARSLALTTSALAFAYMLGKWILAGSLSGLTLELLGVTLVVIASVTAVHWRMGIYLFLVWVVVEDLPRKYLGNNMIVYCSKDALVIVVYLAFLFALIKRQVRTFRPPFWLPLLLFISLGAVQVFNPNSTSLFYGALGVKLYFFYIPLMFVGYALIRTSADLVRFQAFNVALGAAVALLGIVQAIVGTDFLSPRELAPELRPLGQLIRESPITHKVLHAPTSVFVSSGRFDTYLILVFILALGAVAYHFLEHRRGGKLLLAAVGVIAVAALLSGSRATVIYPVASLCVMASALLKSSVFERSSRARLRKAMRSAILAVGACIAAMVLFFPEKVGAPWSFYYETLSPESPSSELYDRMVNYPLVNLKYAFEYQGWPLGYGIGTGSLGVQYLTGLLGRPAPPVNGIENGYGTLTLELGILGPILWLMWSGALVISGWRIVRRLRGSTVYPIAASILWYAFLLLFPFTYGGLAPYQNFILNAYLWLLVGVLFRLPELALETQLRQKLSRGDAACVS